MSQMLVMKFRPPILAHAPRRSAPADHVNRFSNRDTRSTMALVSSKIQQLLDTLKRPKRRPLLEFYKDDDIELEIAANPKDPHAPHPEGGAMTPAVGEPLILPSGLPRQLSKIQYKLFSRSLKVAYMCSEDRGEQGGELCLKSGHLIALV